MNISFPSPTHQIRVVSVVFAFALCGISFVGCGSDKKSESNNQSNSGTDLSEQMRKKEDAKQATAGHANGSSSSSSSSKTKEIGAPSNEKKAASKQPLLKVQIVKGQEEGDIDIFVTNMTDADITTCKVELFEDVKVDVAKKMKPGQVAMCAIGGEIPKSITFVSDQFDSFEYTMPPVIADEIDMTDFRWADMDGAESTTEPPAETRKKPKTSNASDKRKKDQPKDLKDSSEAEETDLMDFGDEDIAPQKSKTENNSNSGKTKAQANGKTNGKTNEKTKDKKK